MSAPSNNPPRRGVAGIVWLVVILALLAGGGLYLYRVLRPTAIVEPVVDGNAIDGKTGNVTVEEEYPEDIKSEIPGRILEQDFNLQLGQIVHKGEVLVRMDSKDAELALQKLEIDQQTLKDTFAADKSEEFALIEAKVSLANARRSHDIGAMSDQDWDNAQRSMEKLQQSFALAKIDRASKLALGQNGIDTAKRLVDKMTLIAPFDGIVKTVFAHPGELISGGAPIATVITLKKNVVGKISDEYFASIKVGQEALVSFVPYGSWLYHGKVTQILPTTDPQTQRHIIYLDVTDIKPELLVPGINGEVAVTVAQHHAATVVPRRAMFTTDGDNVYVVKDGVVHRRRVTAGFVWNRGVEIKSGLEPGDLVLVEGLEDFRDGDHCTVERIPSDVYLTKKS